VEELDHDYLWRCLKALPERGRIGIFNRSYYEEVLVVRVHPEFLQKQNIPAEDTKGSLWKKRYEDINAVEKYLSRNGTIIRSSCTSQEAEGTVSGTDRNAGEELEVFSCGCDGKELLEGIHGSL
jgi:hypothetical protein